MIDGRDITVMLAKIYIDQAISSREDVPDTIPVLMLNYVNQLNKSIPQEKRKTAEEIYQTTKEIAWLCLNKDYRPSSIDKQYLVKILVSQGNIDSEESQSFKERNEEEIKSKLEYLKTNLPVIQIDEETNLVSFRLDPLAEYLAALQLVEYCSEAKGEEAERWQEFLDSVDHKKSPRITIQGFLLAVWDTCWYCQKHLEASIPSHVPDAIIAKADLKEEEFRLAKQTRQIQQLITNLQEWNEPNLIKGLVEQLGEFGEASKSAVPYLIEKFLVEELRPSIGNTLVKIGSKAIPGLLQSLEKGRVDIRRSIAKILGSFESGVEEIIPGLIAALRDDDLEVKREAIFSMGKLGKKAEITVSNLISLVKNVNEDRELRRCAAKALGAIGSDREDVVNALQRITENTAEASDIRLAAIQALFWMENSVPPFIATIHENELSIQPINTSIETKLERLDEDVVLEMILIPSGSFMMGSLDDESGRSVGEDPQHLVEISKFLMSKTPITQAHWRVVASLPKVDRVMPIDPAIYKGDNRPIENICWLDAIEFCNRLSKKTGKKYRLPTEAEWEYTCRAGTTTAFHFGDYLKADLANYGQYTPGIDLDKQSGTTFVGSFGVVNSFGLYDMHGNVWELCADSWHDNYENAPQDGRLWKEEDSKKLTSKIMRGGSWLNEYPQCRSAMRNCLNQDQTNGTVGFRICCSIGTN
jgi:formylglycine-generating enzyme required for sulfatase activity